jgi:hypothetical protein
MPDAPKSSPAFAGEGDRRGFPPKYYFGGCPQSAVEGRRRKTACFARRPSTMLRMVPLPRKYGGGMKEAE